MSQILSREPSDVMHTQRRRVHTGGNGGGVWGGVDGEEKWGGDGAENRRQPGLPHGENKESVGGSIERAGGQGGHQQPPVDGVYVVTIRHQLAQFLRLESVLLEWGVAGGVCVYMYVCMYIHITSSSNHPCHISRPRRCVCFVVLRPKKLYFTNEDI